jgi:[ribosomal protein S5]-alanine N-acetyltransferase
VALLNPFGRSGASALTGGGVMLRHPLAGDYDAWSRLRDHSRAHLQPWEPTWGPDELTRASYRRRLNRYAQEIREDRGYPYWILSPTGQLMGGCTLSNVRRGVSQTATLGYWMGVQFAGKGVMTAAVKVLLGHAFTGLALHRIEAACLPVNQASRNVLSKAGFTEEGFARKYLRIDGQWRDHLLFGIVDEDWRKSRTD